MAQPKILIAFYSTYGTNHKVAQTAADAAREAGADVRVRRFAETAPSEVVNSQDAWKAQLDKMQDIPELSPDDMEWADGYFISAPTRFGVVASQVRVFFDTLGGLWQKGALANKTITATTSSNSDHGGQEMTIQSLYTTAMHWGTIIVAPGYVDPIKFEDNGNPYGFSMAAGELKDVHRKSIGYQARRLVEMTGKLVG